ncbi:MAG TPA: hypothetical protein VN641_19230 [Urbifossiella sp.]|nr:hypothetical protein [Urbifossiella sp.]
MRYPSLLIVVVALSQCGCTAFFVSSGHDPSKITTREEAHAKYGDPVGSGEDKGKSYEEFITHRKIAEYDKFEYLFFGDILTLGLGEIVWFPQELCIAARRSIRGHWLRFIYDEEGRVTEIRDASSLKMPVLSPKVRTAEP